MRFPVLGTKKKFVDIDFSAPFMGALLGLCFSCGAGLALIICMIPVSTALGVVPTVDAAFIGVYFITLCILGSVFGFIWGTKKMGGY